GREELQQLVKSERVDLIHAHSHGAAVAAASLSRALGTPRAVTLHSPDQLRPALGDPRLACICVSREIARPFGKARPDVWTIENGIDLEAFRPPPGGSFARRARGELNVAYLGRVGPSKMPGLSALEE